MYIYHCKLQLSIADLKARPKASTRHFVLRTQAGRVEKLGHTNKGPDECIALVIDEHTVGKQAGACERACVRVCVEVCFVARCLVQNPCILHKGH